MKQDATRNAAYTVDCEDYVHVVEFNPFDSGDSGNLIAYGGGNYVVVGMCTFQEEEADIEGIQYKTLRTFQHGVRVDGIAWSPETRLDSLPPVIKFCTSAADMKIRLFTSDLQDKNEYKVLEGHSDFINGLVFDPKEGQEIASVSDDHTCRIWNLEGIQTAHFVLHSPGMSVCWHPEETFKLMVAEKNGTIRFYDLLTQQAILSLESEQMPLMSAHWCLKNTFKVGAVAGSDWLIWDITRSSYPQDKRPVHMDQACLFRWSTINENLFATTGYPGKIASQFQIHHLGHPQPVLIGSVAVGSGLSWHRTLPLCAIGGDHKLLFWVTEM
ncbi:nucleoporin Nup37 isoform X1 [Neomonachus schauinslandi]|uniref:Nucleoporin Nup37 n=1 Tax=Neomonachus schauinslandi TaxID=29088 RepID=A0A2Y9GVH7_NEOSC|nr:nucleoporin Nup37 isoform X1 [Neomonachus schauinslandi]XP_021543243.1 nucleoporin Nup37 isoform X1 [Neomonachus schauinslandi]